MLPHDAGLAGHILVAFHFSLATRIAGLNEWIDVSFCVYRSSTRSRPECLRGVLLQGLRALYSRALRFRRRISSMSERGGGAWSGTKHETGGGCPDLVSSESMAGCEEAQQCLCGGVVVGVEGDVAG